ncbi:MAG: HutD family protein, partial [Sneathiella sp.]
MIKNHIFHRDELAQTPWKNGGGMTREIARSEEGEPYWRLSIADVTQEGGFSTFAGLRRILTVVEGQGMHLQSPAGDIHARPREPVSFAGDTPIKGHLVQGPVQNFNLIYDANKLKATVYVSNRLDAEETPSLEEGLRLLYCLEGAVETAKATSLSYHSGIINPSAPILCA